MLYKYWKNRRFEPFWPGWRSLNVDKNKLIVLLLLSSPSTKQKTVLTVFNIVYRACCLFATRFGGMGGHVLHPSMHLEYCKTNGLSDNSESGHGCIFITVDETSSLPSRLPKYRKYVGFDHFLSCWWSRFFQKQHRVIIVSCTPCARKITIW